MCYGRFIHIRYIFYFLVGPVDVPYFVTGTVVFEGSLSPVLPLAVAAGQPVNLPKTLHILPGSTLNRLINQIKCTKLKK